MIRLALLGAGAWFLNKKVKENRAAGRSALDFGLNRQSLRGSSQASAPGRTDSSFASSNPLPA